MIDILAPLGLVGFVGLVVALVLAARKQKRERARLFEALAERHGWRYLSVDDGTVQALADGFQGFDQFRYPSGAPRPPSSVVLGHAEEDRVCLFVHATQRTEGDARLWMVCLLEAPTTLGPPMRIHPRSVREPRQVGADPLVTTGDRRFDDALEVYCAQPEETRAVLGAGAREVLLGSSGRLSFPVEVQVRDRRLAAYPASRNDEVGSTAELEALLAFTRALARELERSS
jgi:hypothetical protein